MTPMLLVVGRTGSGKSSVAGYLADKLNRPQVRSFATRPMRPGEEVKSDHIFIQPEEVAKYKDDMSAYTKIGNYEYFTTWGILENEAGMVYTIDPKGVYDLRDSIENAGKDFDLKILYVAVRPDVREQRLKDRGDAPEVVRRRVEAEKEQFDEFEAAIADGREKAVFVVDNSGSVKETNEILDSMLALLK